jgi:hypothetical protein
MKKTVIQILSGLSLSCLSFATICLEAQAQQASARYTGYAGRIFNIPLTLDRPGALRIRATSPDGDADVFVYDPMGRLIGSGRKRGNDFIGGNVLAGKYTMRLRMTRCVNPTVPCNANLTATLDGKPIRFRQNAVSPPDSKNTAVPDSCIEFVMKSQGVSRTSARLLCENLMR